MPYYVWEAVDLSGTIHTGKNLVRSTQELEHQLLAKDLGLVRVAQQVPKSVLRPITSALKYDFYKQLSLLITAGLSLDKALEIIQKRSTHTSFRALMSDIVADVQDGYTLAHGLSHYTDTFGPLVQQVIASTQDSRSLSVALDYLADYEYAMNQFTKKIRASLMMPCITFLFFLVIAGIIVGFIVPRFAQLFASFDRGIPHTTQILVSISQWFSLYGLAIFFVSAASVVFTLYYAKSFKVVRRFMRDLLFNLPFIGSLLRDMALTFYFKSLALLVHNGGNVRKALSCAQLGLRDSFMEEKTSEIIAMVDQGEPLYKAFGLYKDLFSPEVISLLDVVPFVTMLLVIVIVSNLICHNLYGFLLKKYSPTLLSFAGFITPIFAALYGWLFLSEAISWQLMLSSLVIFLGLGIFYHDELYSDHDKDYINSNQKKQDLTA